MGGGTQGSCPLGDPGQEQALDKPPTAPSTLMGAPQAKHPVCPVCISLVFFEAQYPT